MTSSALAGERRWGSARRGGMTVLGKVSVPKPLNLPSQRLENHGLDPNVEIVPKGTLSWGTRSSSSATNPWGSSNVDGRPSSGGSGTRPSTAGSDRVNETSGSAWGPNSRPSSASGILSSDQSSLTSLRPDSADTRPASSHLSRFAEPVADSQGAWGASGTSERLGMVSSKKDDFSLTSGDFPTLGSEKDPSSNNNESKDPISRTIHGLPSGEAQGKDEMDVAFDRSKRDGSEGDGLHPNMEKWQAEHQQYFNPKIPPQHFHAWRGPPMNAPPGVWYRGPHGGPPFRPPVGPGGFPIEPFPYYPQIPPPAFSNSHPVPPPRGGPRGHHPKSENSYRPEMHDAFMHPGMSYRPGFYPPPMAFEGYYGPPRGYCNPNEADVPFMNMGANHHVYDRRYPVSSGPSPSDSRPRAGGPGPASKNKSDDDFFHSGDSRKSAKFISKQQGVSDGKEQAGNREYMPGAPLSHPVKADKTVEKPRKYEWGAEDDEDDDIYSTANFCGGDNNVLEVVRAKASQSFEKPTDDFRVKKSDTVLASSLVSGPKESEPPSHPTGKDATTLMRKIEGLNAKVRYSDVRADCSSSGEEQKRGLDDTISKVDTFPRKSANDTPTGRNSVSEASFTHEVVGPRSDYRMVQHAAAPLSRRPYHGLSNRSDHGGKGKFSNQPADGSQRRPLSAEIPNVLSASKVESNHNFLECGFQQDLEVAEIHHSPKDERGFVPKLQDPIATQAQRAEMREVAKQRALQRQREEEERIREQKAKALAKLEELNRRTQSGDSSNLVAKNSVSVEICKEQQDEKDVESTKSDIKGDSPSLVVEVKNEGALVNDESQKQAVVSSTCGVAPIRTAKFNNSAETKLRQDAVDSSNRGKSSSELDEGFVQRNKSTSYKQKQNKTGVMNHDENSVSFDSTEGRRTPTGTSVKDSEVDVVASTKVSSSIQPHLLNNSNNISSVAQQTSTRSSRNNHKQIDAPPISTAVATGSTQTNHPKTTQEIMTPQAPCLQLSFGTIQVAVNGESGLKMPDQPSSLPKEDTLGKVNNQLKPQHTRRMPRSQQVNNKSHTNAAAVWAPVRSQNKVDISEDATVKVDLKKGPESGSLAKSDNLGQGSSRSKRAEMERYIPKPVAKELAEQVEMQPTLSSAGASTLHDNSSVQPVGSATQVDAGSSTESGLGMAKQNKPGKTHGAWRQRGSTEFSHANNIRQIPSSSDPSKSSSGDVSRNQLYPESDKLQAVSKTASERYDSGSKIASLSSDVPATEMHHTPKDTVITERGKSYSYGGHRKSGNGQNSDSRNVSNAESNRSHVQSPFPDTNQLERASTPKENRATAERGSSHWKPKAYAHSVSSQKGSRITGNHGGGEETRANRKDYPLQLQRRTSPQHDESNDIDGSHSELVPESKEAGRGRKSTSSKSSKENPVDEMELGDADSIGVQHVHQNPAGSRRHGNQVNLSGRGHEYHGDLPVQGHRQNDRARHMHYEYQPVGAVDYKKNNFEGQVDENRNAGSRNRGRGHSHSRRGGGNFRASRNEHLQSATD